MVSYDQLPAGFELEGFAKSEDGVPVDVLANKGLLSTLLPDGSYTSDAGMDQLEIINPKPHSGFRGAMVELRHLVACLPNGWHVDWTARKPGHKPGDPLPWAEKERYRVMHDALAAECPGSWEGVKQMAAWSALHTNLSVSPWSPPGLLLMNVINNVGPYISTQVREEFPESAGHLAVWRGWADERRLPRFGDVFVSHDDFARQFAELPRLIDGKNKNLGPWWVDRKTPQCVRSAGDLGSWWKLARPKRSKQGSYLELRVLPSMPLDAAERYVDELLRGVFALLQWCEVSGNPRLASVEDFAPALKVAARASRLFPDHPLTSEEWEKYFVA